MGRFSSFLVWIAPLWNLYLVDWKYFLIDDQPSFGSSLKSATELLLKLPPLLLFFQFCLSNLAICRVQNLITAPPTNPCYASLQKHFIILSLGICRLDNNWHRAKKTDWQPIGGLFWKSTKNLFRIKWISLKPQNDFPETDEKSKKGRVVD